MYERKKMTEEEKMSENLNQEEPKTEQPKKEHVVTNKSVARPNTDDFDWNALDQEKSEYTEEQQKELASSYEKTFSKINEQEVVEGTIVNITDREIIVDIGFKSDGVIPANELRYKKEELKKGDKIEVYVESQEDAKGQLILSHKKARMMKSWDRVNQACESGEIVNGLVKSKTKGGLIVEVFDLEAFLPGSQIDVKPIRDYDAYVGKTMEFRVVKINNEYKNVVVSHKALIEREIESQRMEIMSGLEKGQVLEGVVKNITNYGAFIDLGGVDGLIHITDLSWGRVADPREVLELDQKINVVILDFDETKKRIALGLKQLTPHPWDSLDPNLKVGDKVKGKVVVVNDYGAFVEIIPGVEGLIHVSEMSWSQHLRTAQDFLSVGQEVETVILTLDRDERKMSLGIKQLIPDPWQTIADKYPVGSKHTATVRNFTNFGIFVELEEGVDGLIHISDLSWSKKIKHPAEFTKVGEKIDVVVLEMDVENRRLSLGHKQLEENPWDVYETLYTVGSVHQGTLLEQKEKGYTVLLQGVEGFAFNRGLQKEDGTTLKQGDTANFKVTEFSKENKKIIVSHTRIWQDEKEAEKENEEGGEEKKREPKKKAVDNIEKTTLGDIDVLVNLKADLEEAEAKATAKKTPAKKATKAKAEKKEDDAVAEEVAEKPAKATKAKATKATKAEKAETAEETEKSEGEVEAKPKRTRKTKAAEKPAAEEPETKTEE